MVPVLTQLFRWKYTICQRQTMPAAIAMKNSPFCTNWKMNTTSTASVGIAFLVLTWNEIVSSSCKKKQTVEPNVFIPPDDYNRRD
ncbi:hypothetical protein DPMN_163442 [Dreissena polymorpha]|uniref:Uncharacterized protein n=1 Tax=Dreissena polymorpha TaxID=45954 RepID=A0A9D4EWN6_DREPO|nr:hypothetical protein DPMN_163442 [Dreissena polymorpha]